MSRANSISELVVRTDATKSLIKISEADWQRTVIDYAQLRKWRVHAERHAVNRRGKWSTPIQGDAGYLDLTMTRNGRLLIVELKSERGTLTPDQKIWIEMLKKCHIEVGVWKPSDWRWVQHILD